ncbi:MAG: type II secretion system F family protein [bacterium]|nr:type II secretion system F family protein [bacterium]
MQLPASFPSWLRRLLQPRVPLATKVFLLNHLRVMISAGIPIGHALESLTENIEPRSVRPMLQSIRTAVEQGKPFAESLEAQPALFPPATRELIRAGESTGGLEGALTEAANALRKERELRSRVQNALLYPAIIVATMIIIGTGVVFFVLPQLLDVFRGVTVRLPLTTRVLLTLSDLVGAYAAELLGVGTSMTAAMVVYATKSAVGRSLWHRMILHAWKFGRIAREVNIARISRTLSGLLRTDVPIVRSLELTAATIQNVHYQSALRDAATAITHGGTLRDSLAHHRDLFPATVLQMVHVGEQTSELHTLLGEVADFYESNVDLALRNLTTIIEPILMLVIGAAVAFLAMAVLQPMYTIAQSI